MPNPPRRRFRQVDPREAAENLFKPAPPKVPVPPTPSKHAHPMPRELVSLRIDRDVLERFQEDGPGWQDRINEALRRLVDG